MKRITTILVCLMFSLCWLRADAGGPLVVKAGKSITYGTRPFLYRYDKGKLGMFSNSEAVAIIEDLFADWQAVKTSEIKFQQDSPGSLDFDVTKNNFDSILNSPSLLGYTPIIFDDDGTLLDAFLGEGSGNSVLGLAGPVTVNSGPLVNLIAESQAIFNGRFVNGIDTPSDPDSSTDAFKGTIIHETGHGIGLDHSQINLEAIFPGASQEIKDSVPLEFPVAVNDLFLIRRDDASSISLLYPNDSELVNFGKIEGRVFRKDGVTPVLGANVIARNVSDPKLEAISCVSDYLTDGTGSYTLFAVPPGSYTIEIEPIDLSFTGGSGVGPYTTSKTDESFQDPVPDGFFTGPDMTITTDENLRAVVTVNAGQNLTSQNIIASTTFVSSSSSSSSSTGGTGTINESEPNNTVSTAQRVSLPATIKGNAGVGDDGELELGSDNGSMIIINDLFKFTIPNTTSINALLVIESDLDENDLDLVLFDEFANEIVESSSQTGNVDELISRTISGGTYLLGIGAFTGDSAYTLTISTSSQSTPPTLSLSGPESIVLSPTGKNQIMIMASATNLLSKTKCSVINSDPVVLKAKPTVFSLDNIKNKKSIRIKIPRSQALSLIETDTTKTATISVTCDNGTSDEIDITISPNIESTTALRDYNKILKTK